ncbi:MAG: restriction endonuclease subunit S [Evtepia gabavorous]|uniref:restriction endonuclease subunit S n=1 Tax=Evtepia gabavorous TaxID=2211183 RepID=UPI0039964B66
MVKKKSIFPLTKLSDVVSMKSGESITAERITSEGKFPCFGGNGLRGYTTTFTHDGSYTLIGRQGALCGNVTFVSGRFYASEHAIVVTPKKETDIKFMSYVLYDMNLNQYSESSAQPGLSVKKLLELEYPIPKNKEEQAAIAEALSNIDSLISALQKLIEKKKSIKQGALQELLTGKKRLPGFSVEWRQALFGDLFDFLPTNAFTRDQMTDNGTIQNVHYGDILTKYGACLDMAKTDVPYLLESVSVRKYSESSYVRAGDVIIADTAEDSTVGKCVELVNVHGKVLSGQHTMLCRPKVTFAPKFLGYYMNAGCFHNQMLPFITGIKVSSISKANISTLVLKYPTLVEEQQAIAQVFSDMDDEIAQLEKKLAKYQQIKQGMMQELLTGRIRLKEGETNA